MCPTWPRWPISQEFAWGLLKQESLCVYQTCRTSSFTVQAATTATSPVPSRYRIWQSPAQLSTWERTPWRRDMLGQKDYKWYPEAWCSSCSDSGCAWQKLLMLKCAETKPLHPVLRLEEQLLQLLTAPLLLSARLTKCCLAPDSVNPYQLMVPVFKLFMCSY